jgi:hypothetical protein
MWITEFRERYGLTLAQLGALIRRAGRRKDPVLRVSDTLLYMLETDLKCRTVPKLADLIAEACGATARQRDALVLPKYRGTWKPTRVKPELARKPPATPTEEPEPSKRGLIHGGANPFPGAREVVKLDRQSKVVDRYRSCNFAAVQNSIREDQVTSRCHRRCKSDEFRLIGYTFRFAAEWDRMTEADRWLDLHRLDGAKPGRGGTHGAHMVTVVDRHQHATTYDSIRAASEATGIPYYMLQHHLFEAQAKPLPIAIMNGLRIMFTTAWDNLTEADWEKFWRLGDG